MNKVLIYVLIAVLIIGGFFIINSQINKSEPMRKPVKTMKMDASKSNVIEQNLKNAKAEAEAVAAASLKEAQKLKEKAAADMKMAQEKAAAEMKATEQKAVAAMQAVEAQGQSQVENLKAQMQDLIAKAKEYLQNADYDNAIKAAQEVLSKFDANSTEAKGIIEAAKEKLKAVAQEKLGDVKNTLGSFGQ